MGRQVVSHSFFAQDVALRRGAGGLARKRGLRGQSGFPGLTERLPRLPPARFPTGVGELVHPARLELALAKTRRNLRHLPQARRALAEVAHPPPPRRRLSLRWASLEVEMDELHAAMRSGAGA